MVALPVATALDLTATSDVTSQWIVAFHAIPQEVRDGHYGLDTVLSVNDAIQFAVVETTNPVGLQARATLDENVRYIEPDVVVASVSLTPNDTFFNGYQYDVKAGTTNIVAAWDRSTGSTAAIVAIADTGFRHTQEDLQTAPRVSEWDFVSNDATAEDGNGHGSHVATTIFATINNGKGIAGISQSSFMPIRVLNNQGSGTCSQVANGITWAGDHGAHVLSMSLGGGACSTEQTAVTHTLGLGTLIVAASGNGGCTNCVEYPAKYAGVVAVGCTDANNVVCSFTSKGPELFISAPGASTPGAYPKKSVCGNTPLDSCYALLSGTSMSTPHVSGVAALIKSTHSAYTATDLKNALSSTAVDLGSAGRDSTYGYGLLQGTAV
jgi:subtilisin family serine protease